MIKTNFHTHSTYCDGKNTPEEMVLEALNKGFTHLGFSGHSFFDDSEEYSMSEDSEKAYFGEINALKEKYKDKIQILCGIEQDYFSKPVKYPYDYKIGSVHYILKNNEFLVIDGSVDELSKILAKHYNGNFDLFAKDYFEVVGNVAEKTGADIIGHFDLILKNQERIGYTPTAMFYNCAEKAVLKLLKYNIPFEINTGAIARGYRTTPYPDFKILKFICNNGGNIIINSDCHQKEYLDCEFEAARDLAIKAGFKKQAILTKDGVKYIEL